MRLLMTACLFIGLLIHLSAQEFNVNVTVKAPRSQTVDAKVYETFEKEVYRFFNDNKWTEDEFEDFEKINGSINITISEELSTTAFVMDVGIQILRPVFNSNYTTQVLNYLDKGINVTYRENQPLQNSFGTYIDPLSSLLTYYVYVMLGYDYDTYAPFGGDAHFSTAQQIVNNVPVAAGTNTGWDSNVRDTKSRYNVVENLLDPRARPFRQAMYEYHLKSLDEMHNDAGKSRAVMVSALTSIEQVNTAFFNSGLVQMFCDSKRKEIIQIFKGGDRGQQSKVYDLMVSVDAARASEYLDIK